MFTNIAASLKTFFSALLRILSIHFNAFYFDLDLIKDVTAQQYHEILLNSTPKPFSIITNFKTKYYYILPLCTALSHHIDSLAILAWARFQYDPNGMPDLISHRVFPPPLWPASDLIITAGITIEAIVYLILLFRPDMDPRYAIYAVRSSSADSVKVYSHGKKWPKREAERLLAFRKTARAAITMIMLTAFIQTSGYFCGNAWINHRPSTLAEWIFWLYLPFFSLWSDFGVVFTSFYIVLTVHYVRIKQQFLLQQITTLTRKLTKKHPPPTSALWTEFTKLNTKVLQLFDQISAYNRFWSPFLTTTLFGHITDDSLMLYAWMSSRGRLGLVEQSFCGFFAFQCFCLILLITSECSIITKNNVKIYKINVEMCYGFMKTKGLPVDVRLRMNKLIANHRGYNRNGFKLITNMLVDSKFFELIFGYTSIIMMYTIKKTVF